MSPERASPLAADTERAGGVVAEYHGLLLVRHYGDPAGEYAAATEGKAVFDRSHRTRLLVSGRSPGRMLSGVFSGKMPGAPREGPDGVWSGTWTYHAVLTPKGKMLSDLWATRLGQEESAGHLLDVPVAGSAALSANFGKVLPPRFAAAEDVSDLMGMVTVVGPEAAEALSRLALASRVASADLSALAEGEWRSVDPPDGALLVSRTEEVWPPAFTVVGPAEGIVDLWRELVAEGARPAGLGVWSTLRVEAGRPVFGTDMDEDTIPNEAGIEDRAIDHTKGCYTGQEVIVRIRDRGHVNRRLVRLDLGDVPAPARGTELLEADGSAKPVGRITSAVESPRHGGVIALAYVKNDVEAVTLDGQRIPVAN